MVISKRIRLQTEGHCDIVDITSRVVKEVAGSDVSNGTVTLFVVGSTAGVTTIEFESGLIDDFKNMWERIIPRSITYNHNRAWGDGNGHSHIRASTLGPSITIPFSNKVLSLGTWQQIVLIDFDNRSRSREIALQIIGE